MPDEMNLALGTEGGGFQVICYTWTWCDPCECTGFEDKKGINRTKCSTCKGKGLVKVLGSEKTWTLSACPKQIQARHVSWCKAMMRKEKQDQRDQGICDDAEFNAAMKQLDIDFAFGHYSFGSGPYWQQIAETPDGLAKLYQLLLEQHHPEVKDWDLQQIRTLYNENEEAFRFASRDILPKAMMDLGLKVSPYHLSRFAAS